jgi:hypothetical protein
MKRLVVGILGLLFLAACPSLSTLQTPSTVPKGDIRFGIGAEAIGISSGSESVTLPQIEFNARYGLTDNLDIGAKLYLVGVEGGIKYQFLRGPLDIAVAPAASWISFSASSDTGSGTDKSSFSIVYLHAPLLFGYNASDTVTIGFGPKFLYAIASGSASDSGGAKASATNTGAMVGGFINLPLRIGNAFWIAPEINVYKPIGSDVSGLLWQGGLAFLFGGPPRANPGPSMTP